MAAVCAVCLAPIGRGGKFVLVDTQVVHPACTANIQRSVVWKLRAHRVQIEGELALARQEMASVRGQLQAERAEVERLKREANADHNHAAYVRTEHAREVMRMSDNTAHVKRALDVTAAERDAALRELAALRAIVATGPSRSESAPEPAKAADPVDGAAIRFALLDLD